MRDLTYFLSDLHLGAGYIPDHRAHERRVVDFLRSIEPRAKRIYLLGDILDYWWEYRDVVPRGFVRFFARFLLEHGDGVGRLPWTFRRLRGLFRCRVAQRLFAAIHPRWTVGFAHAWSSHSRKTGGYVPRQGVEESLVEYAEEYNREAVRTGAGKIDYFIFGHLHTQQVSGGATVVVLGDWISRFSYAVWDGKSLKTEKYTG